MIIPGYDMTQFCVVISKPSYNQQPSSSQKLAATTNQLQCIHPNKYIYFYFSQLYKHFLTVLPDRDMYPELGTLGRPFVDQTTFLNFSLVEFCALATMMMMMISDIYCGQPTNLGLLGSLSVVSRGSTVRHPVITKLRIR